MSAGWLDLPERPGRPLALALGNFDGVHLGHQAVLSALGAAGGLLPAVLVLDPHPRQVLRPEEPLLLLTTMPERAALLRAHGVEAAYRLPFSDQVRQMAPEVFVREVLHERLGVRLAVVGGSYRFGHQAAGDVAALRRLGQSVAMEVRVAPARRIGGQVVSASAIRRQLETGRLAMARRRLGRPYQLGGMVVHGEGRGRQLGFATANLALPPGKLRPADGIYAAFAGPQGGHWQMAAVHLGPRPMFGPEPMVEVHLLDGGGDLYGRQLEVALIRRLRPALAFPTLDALAEQMAKDVSEARRWLSGEAGPPGAVEPATWL